MSSDTILSIALYLVGGSAGVAGWYLRQNSRLKTIRDQALLESHRLGNLIWATDSGTWEWSVKSGELIVSDRWAEILGLTQEEISPVTVQTWFQRIHEEDQSTSGDAVKMCLTRKAEHYKCEVRMRHASGEWIWVNIRGRVVEWDQEGKAHRMAGSLTDITERVATMQRDKHKSRVLQMLATDTPLEVVLDSIARDINRGDPQIFCSISTSDPNGLLPFVTTAPNLPEFFVETLDNFARRQHQYIGVSASSDAVIAYDIATHLSWAPFSDIAIRANLRSCWAQPIVSAKGQLLGTFCIFHRFPCKPTTIQSQWLADEARLTALAIEKSTAATRQRLAANVFTHAREGISITDPHGVIIDVNATFTHITGYEREQAIGRSHRILQSGMHKDEFYRDMWNHLTEVGHWSGEIWNKRQNGDIYAQMTTISAVRDAGAAATNYVALFTDITAIKNHQLQLEHIAHYDALTGLPNRVLLADRLQQGIAQSQRHRRSMAVAYLDLDGFKSINDTHGHKYGDELLIVVARRMKAAMRDGDTLARIGGDEFVAVMVDLEMHGDTDVVLQRLLGAASDPVHTSGKVLQVSASIGVTVYPEDHSEADRLMRHADQAMYFAKTAGKNRFHYFDVAHDAAVQTHHENVSSLKAAMVQKQLLLYYQPKVNLRTLEVVGLEALIRWQHPTKGLLTPASFLKEFEDNPISIEIGEWVIDAVLHQMSKWQTMHIDVPVSVNIGALQLQQPTFFSRIQGLLAKYPDVLPRKLEFEILETSALQDVGSVSAVMHQFREVGIRFSLDDFGTGYSSMTYLKHLPAATLKIDQSFIRDMLSDPDDLSIVKSIIGLTSAFNRDVVAEGVETDDHCGALSSLGCELVQGYGIARPMPAAEISSWVAHWNLHGSDRRSRSRSRPKLAA